MMRTIHKVPLYVKDEQTHTLPKGAKLLAVQVQREQPCLWFECDTNKSMVPRVIKTFGTGKELPKNEALRYIGTYQLQDGALVYHVYEELSAIDALAELI